jgi:hypothetical protein
MASTLKAKGYGDDDILGEFDDNYSFPRQLIPDIMKGNNKKPHITLYSLSVPRSNQDPFGSGCMRILFSYYLFTFENAW